MLQFSYFYHFLDVPAKCMKIYIYNGAHIVTIPSVIVINFIHINLHDNIMLNNFTRFQSATDYSVLTVTGNCLRKRT